jgi:hypothetical protein
MCAVLGSKHNYDLAAIQPKRKRGPDVAGRGEMSRAVLNVLREASEPITTEEVVRQLTAARGVDAGDKAAERRMAKRAGAVGAIDIIRCDPLLFRTYPLGMRQ